MIKLEINLGDSTVGGIVPLSLEGRLPREALIAEHAQTPDVHALVMQLALNHLWGQVVEGPAKGGSPVENNNF